MSLRNTTLAITFALLAGIFMLDCATGRDFNLWFVYLLPVGFASFVLGARYGYGVTLATALLLLATTGIYDRAIPTIRDFISIRGTEATVFVICVYLIGLMRLAIAGVDGKQAPDTPSRMD